MPRTHSIKEKFLTAGHVSARFLVAVAFLLITNAAPASELVRRWVRAGSQAAQAGEYERALDAYNRALRLVGPQTAVYERLVQVSLDAEQYDQARVYLYALADLDGWTGARREQLAEILRNSGESAQAAAVMYAALQGQSDDPVALRELAQQQIAQQEWDQAKATLGRLIALTPDDAEALYEMGVLVAPENRANAADYLARAALDPDWAARANTILSVLSAYDAYSLTDAHTHLGVALVELGEWPLAEGVLQMALDVNAVNPTARAYLGFVRDQQGRDGLPDIQSALAMSPNDPVIYYLLGVHWRRLSKHEEALADFRQAYWLDPDNPALAAEIGTSLQNLGNLAEAETWFQKAVDLAPSDIRWRKVMAAFYADTGFQLQERGLAYIEQIGQLDLSDPGVRASLGWAYFQTDDTQRAYEELSAAVGMDPSDVRSRYYFGVVLERRGDSQGAADSYQFVVQKAGPDGGFGLLAARALRRLGYG
jgi:tetratricopeptide (TPR) repeat protein